MLMLGERYHETVAIIVDNSLGTASYFTLYEVKVRKQVEQQTSDVLAKKDN